MTTLLRGGGEHLKRAFFIDVVNRIYLPVHFLCHKHKVTLESSFPKILAMIFDPPEIVSAEIEALIYQAKGCNASAGSKLIAVAFLSHVNKIPQLKEFNFPVWPMSRIVEYLQWHEDRYNKIDSKMTQLFILKNGEIQLCSGWGFMKIQTTYIHRLSISRAYSKFIRAKRYKDMKRKFKSLSSDINKCYTLFLPNKIYFTAIERNTIEKWIEKEFQNFKQRVDKVDNKNRDWEKLYGKYSARKVLGFVILVITIIAVAVVVIAHHFATHSYN